MDPVKDEQHVETLTHEGEQQKVRTPPKAKARHSKFEKWRSSRFIRTKYNDTRSLLKKHKRLMSQILTGEIESDGRYHPVPSKLLEEIISRKGSGSRMRPLKKILSSFLSLERRYGIILSVNLPRYNWSSRAVSRRHTLKIKSNKVVETERENAKFTYRRTSRLYPPLDIVELNDLTGCRAQNESVFLELISTLENRYYPTAIKYKYDPHPRRKGQGIRRKDKALVLYVPYGLNPSDLSELFGAKLKQIWEGFYKVKPAAGSEPRAEKEVRKAMKALQREGNIIPAMSIKTLKEEIPKRAKVKESYLEKCRSIIQAERRRYTQQFIISGLREMGKVIEISKTPNDELISQLIQRAGMSSQVGARFRKDFLQFIQRQKRNYTRGG